MARRYTSQYNSLDVAFPDKAYMVYIVARDSQQNANSYPLTPIFYTLEEVTFYIRESEEHFIETEEYSIKDSALLLPIHLERLLPLKEEYWHGPTQHYDGVDRLRLFRNILDRQSLHSLLVTPSGIDEEQNIFLDAALPLLSSASEKALEQFLKTSDYPVLEAAKNAAIYSFGIPFYFNWQTEKISLIDHPQDKQPDLIN